MGSPGLIFCHVRFVSAVTIALPLLTFKNVAKMEVGREGRVEFNCGRLIGGKLQSKSIKVFKIQTKYKYVTRL
jgi:hypothetical protein